MQQKYFSAKTGAEVQRGALKEQPKGASFDGQKPEPKKEAAPAPKQRRERSDSLVQRIMAEIKKMATSPDSGQKEAAGADAEKKRIKRSGGDIVNPNRKSAEAKADSYDANVGQVKPKDQSPPINPGPMPSPMMPPVAQPKQAPPISQRPGRGPAAPPINPGPMQPKGPAAPPIRPIEPPTPQPQPSLPPMPPMPQPPAPKTQAPPIMPPSQPPAPMPMTPKPPSSQMPPRRRPGMVDAGYGVGPLIDGFQRDPNYQGGAQPMDAVYDGLMSAFIRRTQKK